jgi:hypothetical protein
MLKKLFFCTLFLLPCCVLAQQSMLLKIQAPESETASYIFATTQHKDVAQYNISEPLLPVIQSVNTVVFDWLQDETQRQKMFDIMQLKEEQSLKKIYSREDNIRYELMVINKLKTEVAQVANTQPLYTMQLFRDVDYANGAGFQNNTTFQLALEASKPVISIFNPRVLEEIFVGIDYETQAKILSGYVNNADAILAMENANLLRYVNGDFDGMHNAAVSLFPAAYYANYLNKKIEIIYSKIASFTTQQSVLFVLEAEVLGGENGLLKKLEAAGYVFTTLPASLQSNSSVQHHVQQTKETDHFPTLHLADPVYTTSDVKIFTGKNALSLNSPIALYDPFNDLFDYANADTSFLKSWYSVRGSEGKCTVKTPVQAQWESSTTPSPTGDIRQYTYAGNHAKSDLYYSFGYTIYPVGFDAGNKSVFFNDFVKRQAQKLKGEILAQRIISTPDYTGRECTILVSDSFFVRSRVLLKNNVLYQMLCGGPNNNAYGAYADAFFRSFNIEPDIANDWFHYENAFFNCNLPTEPLAQTQKINLQQGTLTLQTFSSEDYQEGISYLISVFLYPPSYDFGNENNFLDELVAGAEKQYVGRAIVNEKVKKDGLTGRYVELQLNNTKIYKLYFFYRGNTVYQYLAGGSAQAMLSKNPQYFFDTLSFAVDEK